MVAGILLNPNLGISESVLDKPNPVKYALRQVERASHAVADGWPTTTKSGKPTKSYENAIVALSRLELVLEHDRFHNRKRVGGRQIQDYAGDLTDDGAAVVRKCIVDQFGFDPGKQNLLDAIQTLCVENGYHPILDYLRGLDWDQLPRLDTWLTDYLGAEDTPYVTHHSARHSFVSALQAHGVEVGLVAKLAGHANPAVTLGHYTQAVRGGAEAVALLDAAYGG